MLPFPIMSNTNILPELDIKGTATLIGTTQMFYSVVNSTAGDCYFARTDTGFFKYNSTTNTFDTLTGPIFGVTECTFGSFGDYIYRSGGLSSGGTKRGEDLFRYTISTDTWSILAGSAIPTNFQTVTANSNYAIKVLGAGVSYRYNTSTNTYQTLSTMPTMLSGSSSTDYLCVRNINDTMYYLSRSSLSSMNMNDSSTAPVFTTLAEFPGYVSTTYIAEMCVYKDNLYVLTNRSELYYYNVSNGTWKSYGVICPVSKLGFNTRTPVLFCASVKDSCLYCLIPQNSSTCNMYKIT